MIQGCPKKICPCFVAEQELEITQSGESLLGKPRTVNLSRGLRGVSIIDMMDLREEERRVTLFVHFMSGGFAISE